MVKRPIFALFLTISIIIILVGIALIIAIQIDRGYVLASVDQDFDQKQDDIVREFYQHSSDSEAERETSFAETRQPAAMPATQAPASRNANTSTTTTHTANEQADSYRRYLEHERRWLSMNPWSPDYRPPGTR